LEADIAKLNDMFNLPEVKQEIPEGATIRFANKRNSFMKTDKDFFSVYVVKKSENNIVSTPDNQLVEKANVEISSQKANEIYFKFNDKAALQWQALTQKNIKKAIAIIFDNKVYSAPIVQNVITGGRCSITGDFTHQEAKDMVVILNSGTLLASVSILQKTIE
jgi:preprotein translocase subunit SecD